jgi:UDP-N-acetyl-D-glucosamine dehydrogenase
MNINAFISAVGSKETRIGIIGLGYVGLPLMLTCIKRQFRVIGFDTDASKVSQLMQGKSYIKHIQHDAIEGAIAGKMFYATSNFEHLRKCDAIIICVPTPLTRNREPDMKYVEGTARQILPHLQPDQLVVLESTSYPGTTDELVRGILESDGLKAGIDFYLAFSPEREDPGNKNFNTKTIPKVVGGFTPACLVAAHALYSAILDKVVTVSSTRAAEMTKLLENTFRSVNIALVNELKMLCDAMGIDIWEVIDAAATKPFGYMAFYPGPGLGGHCIPVDPFYLTWKAREYGLTTRFIELAGEINTSMPHYVVDKITAALNDQSKSVRESRLLIVGVAYKSDVDDMRESPALPIIQTLLQAGACVRFHDPYIPKLWAMRRYDFSQPSRDWSFEPHSVELAPEVVATFDAAIILTKHTGVDYDLIVRHCPLIVDCRNATGSVADPALRQRIVKA